MRSALRKLCHVGEEALKPHKINDFVWGKPVISKRVANVLRKQAMKEGTYGSFNATTGTGWDPTWDVHVKNHKSTHLPRLEPPKLTSRERTREARAKKIELLLQPVDENIEQYYQRKADKKPTMTFELRYKNMIKKTISVK